MKGIDSNVLLRLLVADDREQQRRALRYLESQCTVESPGFINLVVVCELVWVLQAGYGYDRAQIASLLDAVLATESLLVDSAPLVRRAAELHRGGVDFADALIALTNERAGCSATATFDRRAAKTISQFEAI